MTVVFLAPRSRWLADGACPGDKRFPHGSCCFTIGSCHTAATLQVFVVLTPNVEESSNAPVIRCVHPQPM